MIKNKFSYLLLLLVLSSACSSPVPDDISAIMQDLPEQLDFNIHVKPILSDRCFACHGPDQAKRKADLRLDVAEAAYAELVEHPGKRAIKPGSLRHSEVFQRIIETDPEKMMPPPESDLHLSLREKAILSRWIAEGAIYKPHWAFIPPTPVEVPSLTQAETNHPIDAFIRQQLAQKGWKPSPEADKETLLRRLSLDLTGLPPTVAEMDEFLNDPAPEAYEKAVDRLLQSAHYGERMATEWMDLARFADTHGYTVDRYRDMSPWRDWVIKAFNENMPYDQFVTWQLAGDLLPDPTQEQILATGFNRNHQQNMEGGIVEEEFRVEYVADRTNTLGKAFLGLTMECARCHDHKYDPISQQNYYELFSFFNNIREAGQISWNDATPVPTLLLSDERVDSIRTFLQQEITQQEQEISAWEQKNTSGFDAWLQDKQSTILLHQAFPSGMVAHYSLDALPLTNSLPPYQEGKMKTQQVSTKPELVPAYQDQGLLLDGDAWLDLGTIGAYERSEPFSIGIRVKIPSTLKNGVIFHKGIGAALYNWRGYHLAIKDNKLEMIMAHTAPYNAIIEYGPDLPRDQFIHLTMTYDGSGTAAGLQVFLDGEVLSTEIENDNLYKTILFNSGGSSETGLQIGARWRGVGIKDAVVDEITVFERELTAFEVGQLAGSEKVKRLIEQSGDQLSAEDRDMLKPYYLKHIVPGQEQLLKRLQALRQKANHTSDTLREIMVMQEMEHPRPSFILNRGQYDAHGAAVFPNTPESILAFPEELPKNRLGLAQWLFQDDHPLTARVAVNRLWQQFFGRGLVRTTEDFGNQGELPSHPELLDWLAISFRESGWDIKNTIKQIVLSATYRQASISSEKLAQEDPQNKWLARGPSRRLTAEMLRDNALAASGLLTEEIGGPSVKPYQPDGLWRINGGNYQTSSGKQLYRRSLYTFWKRTVPHPTQATFDAPARDNCTVRRQKTSTPLQALVLLNDPVYLEAARLLGQRISKMEDPEKGIQFAFRLMTGRRANPEEMALLLELREKEYQKFQEYPAKMAGWLTAGAAEVDQTIPPPQLAANTVVASTIINTDAAIIKR